MHTAVNSVRKSCRKHSFQQTRIHSHTNSGFLGTPLPSGAKGSDCRIVFPLFMCVCDGVSRAHGDVFYLVLFVVVGKTIKTLVRW